MVLAGSFSSLALADVPASHLQAPKSSYDPIDQYAPQEIEGWTVRVNKRLLEEKHQKLGRRTLKLLEDQLFRIAQVVPPGPLAKLRRIPIWVELEEPHHPCMCYHVSAGWLSQHGMNPQKAGAVEIANAENFLSWSFQQPWMVLHELSHGYHDQVLGFDNPEIRACYDQAVASRSYESVLHWDGRKVRAYALTNEKEYFAETTEAFFGTNDFYPFVRSELKEHDPKMYQLLEKFWETGAGGPEGAP
ncbi:MAG: hypothetical protein JO112_18795 [Planctomycetes bacterium]|nr:hypothetical protein [Planctomycetota bacterium]